MWVVMVVALALAVGLSGFAWRLLRNDRHRTEARAAMLRQLAFEPEPEWQDAPFQEPVTASAGATFGSAAERTEPHTRRWMAAAVVVVFMAVGAASVYGVYGPTATDGNVGSVGSVGSDGNGGSDTSVRKAVRRGEAMPLELLSLSHRVDAEDFVVAGLVQNPVDGRTAPTVMAVVYAFNAKGEYFASGKAALEFAALAPGAESPFEVRLPKITGVTRFRIGFRAPDGSVVAHVDRRGQPIEGTTPATVPEAGGR